MVNAEKIDATGNQRPMEIEYECSYKGPASFTTRTTGVADTVAAFGDEAVPRSVT